MVSDSSQFNPFSTLEEAELLLSKVSEDLAGRIILIGGQALLLWAEFYLIDGLTGRQYDFLASNDLDFMGRRPEVVDCAAAWNAEFHLPTPEDNTPNSGIVLFNNAGVFEAVDFLPNVYGLSDRHVIEFSDEMLFGDNRIKVLSPPLCLKSRIANLEGLGYSELKKEREVIRIKAAAEIVKFYLIDICNSATPRVLSNVVSYLMQEVLLSRQGIVVSAQHNVDLSTCFPIEIIRAKHAPIADKFLAVWLKTYHDRVIKHLPKTF